MLIRIRHLPYLLLVIVIVGVLLGFKLEPWVGWRAKKPQVILAGSGNVYPFLMRYVPHSLMDRIDPVWLDQGSGDAQTILFSAFNFGRSVTQAPSHRVGLIAMSSNGTKKLTELLINEKESDRTLGNFFLSILIAKQPLAVIYRGILSDQLHVQNGSRLPPELGSIEMPFRYVQISDLKDIVQRPESPGFIRYCPGINSGTRALFESSANDVNSEWGDNVSWTSDFKEVPDYVEDLGDTSPFLELASEPQESSESGSSPSCKQLRAKKIEAAIICTGMGQCQHAVTANYTLIFKVARVSEPNKAAEYNISNSTECRIAQVFTSTIRPDCFIDPPIKLETTNVVTKEGPLSGLPDYLKCLNGQ
jgi:hypothetical protein